MIGRVLLGRVCLAACRTAISDDRRHMRPMPIITMQPSPKRLPSAECVARLSVQVSRAGSYHDVSSCRYRPSTKWAAEQVAQGWEAGALPCPLRYAFAPVPGCVMPEQTRFEVA